MGTETLWRAAVRRSAVAVTLAAVIAVPAIATPRPVKRAVVPKFATETDVAADHLRVGSLASFNPSLVEQGRFRFTAPGQGPANARLATTERAFRFTPSAKPRGLSIGVASRVLAATVDTSRAAAPVEVASVAPAAYNVDLAVGWGNFAIGGGYSRSETLGGTLPVSLTPRREAVDLGVSYRGRGWKTSLQVAAEAGSPLLLTPLPSPAERKYSVELGGAYLVTPKLSVNGGVRYKLTPGSEEPARTDQSVYFGTALSF